MKQILAIIFSLSIFVSSFAQEFNFVADTTTGCSPLKILLKNTTDKSIIDNYTYEWSVEKGTYFVQTDSVQKTYINPGTYSISMRVKDGSKVIKTITKENYITVYNDPDVTIKSDKEYTCENKPFQFSIENIISDTSIVSYTWILSDGTSYLTENPPLHTFGFADDFEIFLSITDAHGCSNRERKTITVKTYDDYPAVSFTVSKTRVCEPQLTVNFTNQTEEENIVSFHWDYGDGNEYDGKTAPSHTYNGFGTYYPTLSAMSKSECEGTSARSIKLIDYQPEITISDEYPAIDFNTNNIKKDINTPKPYNTISNNPTKTKFCPGIITFSDANPSDNNSWQWDFMNDGTIESNDEEFQVEITEAGTYSIKLLVSNGTCQKEIIKTFTIEEPLKLIASPTDDFYCSTPASVSFSATSNIDGTKFCWGISDNTMYETSSFSKSFAIEGIFSTHVYAISPNYCISDTLLSNNIEITLPRIYTKYANTYASPRSGCVPLDVDFAVGYSYNTDKDSIAKIIWTYDEKSTDSDVDIFNEKSKSGTITHSYTYDKEGVYAYSIYLKTNKGCTISNTIKEKDSISVGRTPDVTIDFAKELCASDSLVITVSFDDITRYESQYDTLTMIFAQYAPWPLAPNQLPTDIYSTIEEKSPVTKSFAMSFTDTIGLHLASYKISDNGCSADVDLNDGVTIKGPMTFITASKTNCKKPYEYQYSFLKNYNAKTWEWFLQKVGDKSWTQIAENIDTLNVDFSNYGGRGQYYIKATSHNPETGCDMSDSILTHVTDIVADFELETYTPCLGDVAKFVVDERMGQDIATWMWLYNWNGKQDSLLFAKLTPQTAGYTLDRYDYSPRSPKYTFDTTNITSVTVKVTDSNGCSDTITKPVKVFEVHADFEADVISDCLPFVTNFTDKSTSEHAITQRTWNLGNETKIDGNETSIQTEYNTKGNKTVSLTIVDDQGCKNTATMQDYIKPVVPNSQFNIKNEKVCLGRESEFMSDLNAFDYENTLSKYTWDFGDGNIEEASTNLPTSTTHVYSKEGKYNVTLTTYCTSPENHECIDSTTRKIDIKSVGANIKIKDSDQCKEPGQKFIVYLDNSIYNTNMKSFSWWKFDGGDSIFVSNKRTFQVVTFNNFGDQSLWLNTKSDYYGCEDTTISIPIHVPGYEATIISDKSEACIHEDITFTLQDTLNLYRYNCYWEFGDGETEEMEKLSTQHQYTALAINDDNTYKVQFFVDAPGCKTRDISVNVKVFPVIAMFTRGLEDLDTAGCAPYSVQLFNTSVAGSEATYLWDFGNGETSTEKNPIIKLSEIGETMPISLSVTSNICNDTIKKNVSSYPVANITIDMDSTICFGETISATASGNFTSIQWQPVKLFSNSKSPNTTITIPHSQYIYIDSKNKYNCNHRDSVFVYVQQKPYYYGAPDSLLLFYNSNGNTTMASQQSNNLIAGQIYNLNATGIQGIDYVWSPATYLSCTDCESPDVDLSCTQEDCLNFPEYIDYQISMTDSLGCFSNDTTIHFNIIIDSKIALPEAFTPNGDGINDVAFVRGWGIKDFLEVKIFNRWGQIIFESDDMTIGWDGTFHDEPQAMDTYSYTIKAKNLKDEEIFVKGYITLIR